jgi:hypothetical protein
MKGNIFHECDRRWILGHLCEDKALKMTNKHREGVDQLIRKQDESTIEPKTYENPPESQNSSTMVYERGQDRTSEPNRFKIKILAIDNDAPPKVS